MSKWETIYSITGLFLIDGLANAGIILWARYDPGLSSPVVYFLIIPVINLFAVFLAFMQLYYYRHPEEEESEE